MNVKYLNHKNPDLSHLSELDKKPTIGLDLDNVLCSTKEGFINKIESQYNIIINQNIHTKSNPNIPHLKQNYGQIIRDIVNQDLSVYDSMEPIQGSSKATNILKDYYNIKIITHRVHNDWLTPEKLDELKSKSIKWLNDNNIYFDEFVYPTPKDKSDVQADVYIDDNVNNINNILNKENNIGVLYLRSYNQDSIPWNSWLASSVDNNGIKSIVNDNKKQWEVITNEFTSCLQN